MGVGPASRGASQAGPEGMRLVGAPAVSLSPSKPVRASGESRHIYH